MALNSPKEAAAELGGVSEGTLANWRVQGKTWLAIDMALDHTFSTLVGHFPADQSEWTDSHRALAEHANYYSQMIADARGWGADDNNESFT